MISTDSSTAPTASSLSSRPVDSIVVADQTNTDMTASTKATKERHHREHIYLDDSQELQAHTETYGIGETDRWRFFDLIKGQFRYSWRDAHSKIVSPLMGNATESDAYDLELNCYMTTTDIKKEVEHRETCIDDMNWLTEHPFR